MKHLGTKLLETDRLILRRFTPHDISAVYNNWASDKRVTKYLTWPTHSDIKMSEDIVNEWVSSYLDDSFYQWAIVVKGQKEPVGTISVVNSTSDTVEIGYCLGFKWWNKGYTSEAFGKIIPYLFNEVEVSYIESKHNVLNPRPGKVMQKCSLEYIRTDKEACDTNSGLSDLAVYRISSLNFKNNK